MISISRNLQSVRARIADAARKYGRDPAGIALLAASKTWSAERIADAARAGQKIFGENYVGEGVPKIAQLAPEGLEWHFIGPLQSNKTRPVAENFAWAHSIDRLKIAERLSAQRSEALAPLQVCLQINTSGEASKSGVPPSEALALARLVVALPRLVLRGLMSIPEPEDDFLRQRAGFARLRELFDALKKEGIDLDTLSMGMSHDLEAAIAEGSTLVRVGTAIFGEREKK
ncbi:MAG: YggS family pyridoxal phosphate-dependent enzyme [Candidatus Accumulibacter sp.]|jgi:pyridoxal phosphate enzyme (YggS family)|nr:YggS family pyridoxal phosphate-dependent enzyme [Accumulibacter sp.]